MLAHKTKIINHQNYNYYYHKMFVSSSINTCSLIVQFSPQILLVGNSSSAIDDINHILVIIMACWQSID